jgi:hypothetical protein
VETQGGLPWADLLVPPSGAWRKERNSIGWAGDGLSFTRDAFPWADASLVTDQCPLRGGEPVTADNVMNSLAIVNLSRFQRF